MRISRANVERWIQLLRERARTSEVSPADVFDVLDKELGRPLVSTQFPQRSFAAGLDDDALADVVAGDMIESLEADAAGAVHDIRIVELSGPVQEGPELDSAVRAWMRDTLDRVQGLGPDETVPLKAVLDSLEQRMLGKP